MDCPYKITVEPETHLWDASSHGYIEWLRDNNIENYRWRWTDNISPRDGYAIGVIFWFEHEQDKLMFALRWA